MDCRINKDKKPFVSAMNYQYYNYFMNRLNVTKDLYDLLINKFNDKSLNVDDIRNLD